MMSCSNHVQRWKLAANGQGKFIASCVIDQPYNKKRPSDFEGLAFLSAAAEFYLSGILTFASGRLSR
jgi:hypothetical protein